jgi:hypothetical protein
VSLLREHGLPSLLLFCERFEWLTIDERLQCKFGPLELVLKLLVQSALMCYPKPMLLHLEAESSAYGLELLRLQLAAFLHHSVDLLLSLLLSHISIRINVLNIEILVIIK